MNVKIYSRKAMEDLLKDSVVENTAVISFYDPPTKRNPNVSEPVDYTEKCDRVFHVGINDIEIEILGDYDLTYDTYFPEADELAEFIYKAKRDGCDIICQCEYGQSRSAACAAAILEHFLGTGISVFADYRYYPNQMVYHKVFDALVKVNNIEIE